MNAAADLLRRAEMSPEAPALVGVLVLTPVAGEQGFAVGSSAGGLGVAP